MLRKKKRMIASLPLASPLANLQVDHAGKIASKGRSGEVSRSVHNGKMTKNLTSYLND